MELTRAIVCSPPEQNHTPGSNWLLQQIQVPTELGDGELLIEMTAVGICHTDIMASSFPAGAPGVQYPQVLGHEGSGYVRAIGPNCKKNITAGDPVLLSYDSCMSCHYCKTNKRTYCSQFMLYNISSKPGVFESEVGEAVAGKFFGQSSFAALSVVRETCVLPARELIQNERELALFAPLGCGLQTGAGAVLNVAKPQPEDRVLIAGLGGVGLGALMAAVIAGASQIIAVDRVQSRIDLAKSLGATHGLNTTGVDDTTAAMKDIAGGLGPTCLIETTGAPSMIEAAYQSVANQGSMTLVGATLQQDYELKINTNAHLTRSIRLLGSIEGDSVVEEFIPRLIEYYREGRFPIDRISKYYKIEDFKTALHDMHTGGAIKPILLWK